MHIFKLKTTSENLSKVQRKNNYFFLGNLKISYLEICGVIISITSKSFLLTDFNGQRLILKSSSMNLENGTFNIEIKPFISQDSVHYFCIRAKKIDFYEEICSQMEAKALIKNLSTEKII